MLGKMLPARLTPRWAALTDMAKLVLLLVVSLFLLSTITLTFIQIRLARQFGWRVFRERSMKALYWTDLSWQQRLLLWPGVVAFFVILVAGLVWK